MKKLFFISVVCFFLSAPLQSGTIVRIVPFSPSVTVKKVTDKIASATVKGIPVEPKGVPEVEKIYKKLQSSYINLDYPSVIKSGEEAINIVQANLKDIKEWNKIATILKLGAVAAFATRNPSKVDKFLWNMVKYFPEQKMEGKAIPPDLYLRWKEIKRKTIFVEVSFTMPVSDTIINFDGRVINGTIVKVPQGVHQIFWKTPYESGVIVRHLYSRSQIDIPEFPVDLNELKRVVLAHGWCSDDLKSFFELSEIDTPVLFINNFSPHLVLIDPSLGGVILEGDNIFSEINSVLEEYDDPAYTPQLYCRWNKSFYRSRWFYFGISAVIGGIVGGYQLDRYIDNHNTVIISW